MINQLMQKKFATTNYSPDDRCCSLDASDSLKDFSMGVGQGGETHRGPIPAGSTPNEYKQGRQIGPNSHMMSAAADFNQNNLLKLPYEEKYYRSNNTSMAGVKDSISTCQNVRQKALPHAIHAHLQTEIMLDEETLQEEEHSGQLHVKVGDDSTLLNTTAEKSHASNHAGPYASE